MRCIQAKVFRQDRGVRVDFDHIKISHSSSEVILFIKYRDQFPPDRTQAFQNDAVGQVIGLKTSCQFHHLLQAGFFFQLVDSRAARRPLMSTSAAGKFVPPDVLPRIYVGVMPTSFPSSQEFLQEAQWNHPLHREGCQ